MPMGGNMRPQTKSRIHAKAGSAQEKKMEKSSGKSLTSGLKRFQGVLKEGQTLKNIDGVTYVFDKDSLLKNAAAFKGTF